MQALCCFLPSNRLPLAESELLVPDNPHLTHAAGNGRAVGRTPRWRALASSLAVGAAVKFIFHRSKRISPNLVAPHSCSHPPLIIEYYLFFLFCYFLDLKCFLPERICAARCFALLQVMVCAGKVHNPSLRNSGTLPYRPARYGAYSSIFGE